MKEELFTFLAANEDFNVSDGVWMQMLKDNVEIFNNHHGTNFEPHNVVMEFIESTCAFNEE